MIYKIIIDKQSRTNPSADRKTYLIDTDELRTNGKISDSIEIEKENAYVIRRLQLSEYHVLTPLKTPIKQKLNIQVELFEGENYIYLIDMVGNKIYAEYIIKNDFNDIFATKVEMNSAINQSTRGIELSVNQKFESYSTTAEMNVAINVKSEEITSEVNKKVGKTEVGTYIQQNTEAVKVAWNQISEFIQMMILNGNASLAILDNNKKVLMSLDKSGQHFHESGTKFGEMGVKTQDDNKYIAFSVDSEYNTKIKNGMAWGVVTTSDGKFWPILYIKDFAMPPKNSGGCTGQLVLSGCDLVLDSSNAGIISNGVKIQADAMPGIFFNDEKTNSMLFYIMPATTTSNASMGILDNIQFYKNQAGSDSFKIGTGNSYVLVTDEGDLSACGGNIFFGTESNKVDFILFPNVLANIYGDLSVSGNVYANNISSDRRIKKNIKKCSQSALEIIKKIKHKQFDKEDDGKHYDIGYIAQEMEMLDPNFVIIRPQKDNIEERYYINELPIIATATKAIQEQQEMIEQLQEKDKQKDKEIDKLIKRIETLEKEARNGNN